MNIFLFQVFIAIGILLCYVMGRSLEWNWLALASCVFLVPFTFGLYFIPEVRMISLLNSTIIQQWLHMIMPHSSQQVGYETLLRVAVSSRAAAFLMAENKRLISYLRPFLLPSCRNGPGIL